VAFGLWATMSQSGQVLAGQWSFVNNASVDRGTYFRLKIDFAYRGEPQHFDIVVGCNVLNIRYKDGSGTYEAGLVPTVYGQRMSDGKAVVVRPPDACRGDTTANGGVAENFLPVMIVYDDANTLAFGTGYMTDEAYQNPRSLMTFSRATVESATRQEFDAFYENGPPNVVMRSQYHSFQPDPYLASRGLQRTKPAFGRHCRAYSRWKLSDAEQEIVRKYRPAGGPRYWTISDTQTHVALEKELYGLLGKEGKIARDDGLVLNFGEGFEQPDFGALRRDGVRPVGRNSIERSASIYPASTSLSQDRWPVSSEDRAAAYAALTTINIVNVDLAEGQTRGFAYCYSGEHFWGEPQNYAKVKAASTTTTVDGHIVEGGPDHWNHPDQVDLIFDGEDYLMQLNSVYYLESTRGDI
jgi:hypothetical protein